MPWKRANSSSIKHIAPLADKVWEAHSLCKEVGNLTNLLFVEDKASMHTGDVCKETKEGNLKAKCRAALAAAGLIRELIPETPELCPNVQIHKILKYEKQKILARILGPLFSPTFHHFTCEHTSTHKQT